MTGIQSETPLANVRPLHPIRVLLAASDPRYVRVTRFLLARAGFAVESCPVEEAIARVAERHPHVVVLDATAELAATLRLRSALVAGHGDVAVVLVSERPPASRATPRVLPKWGRGELLLQEIERAYLHPRHDDGLLSGTE